MRVALTLQTARPGSASPKTNGFVERFNGTVLDEFFRPTMRSRLYESVDDSRPTSTPGCITTTTRARTWATVTRAAGRGRLWSRHAPTGATTNPKLTSQPDHPTGADQ